MRSDDPCSKYFVSQRRASRYICCVSYFIPAWRHCGLRIWHTRPSAPSAIHVRPCGRAITLREIDFARCAHTKVWGFGKWVAYPPHVRRASELYVGACLCVFTRYGGLVEKFWRVRRARTVMMMRCWLCAHGRVRTKVITSDEESRT